MNLDHEMESDRTSSHQQWQCWKYAYNPREGVATRPRTVWTPELGQRAVMGLGVLETAATWARTAKTPELGQLAGTARGVLEMARPPGRGRRGNQGRGRRGEAVRGSWL